MSYSARHNFSESLLLRSRRWLGNALKYDKTEAHDSASGQIAPLYHPRRDSWNEHFAWSDNFTLLIGITPTGRATVDALLLNRDGVVNLRGLLYMNGEHPPRVP